MESWLWNDGKRRVVLFEGVCVRVYAMYRKWERFESYQFIFTLGNIFALIQSDVSRICL